MLRIIGIVFFTIQIFFILNCKKDFTIYKANQGILDLKNWNPTTDPVISLDGDWEFYWNELLEKKDFKERQADYIRLPSTWNDKGLKGSGYATFRLKVILPDNNQYPTFAIRIKPFTNCRAFINEQEIPCMGKLGLDFNTSIPDTRPSLASFAVTQNELDVIIQISNFHHRKGGFLYSVYFGTEEGLFKFTESIRNRDSFILGILFFVMIYHIGLYLIRRKEILSIYFTLVVLCIFLRTASTGEKLIVDIFSVNYPVYVAIEYITFFLAMPLVINLVIHMFSMSVHRLTVPILFFKSILFSSITLFTDANFYSNLVTYYLPLFVLELIFAYLLVVYAVIHKKENAKLILVGFSIMILFTANDILSTTEIIHTNYIAHYGLISVIFCQSLYLLLRFVKAFKENENLSTDLKKINEKLEEKIEERTKEIMEEKIMAIKANEMKDKFISLLSHDLRSPMGNAKMLIESAVEADDASEKELSRNYLDLATKSITNAVEMTQKILQFSQTQTGHIDLNIQTCYPSRVADKIFNMMLSKIREKKIQLLNFIDEEEKIETDEALFQEVLFNLISNSIKFSKPGDLISIRSEIRPHSYLILVKDTGVGIPQEIKVNLFSHTVRTTSIGTSGEIGTGLGLPLCKDIVKLLKGEIYLNEEVTDGTEFVIELPLHG